MKRLFFLILIFSLLAGCLPKATQAPTPTPLSQAVQPSPTLIPPPSPSATPAPAISPTPRPIPAHNTPTPLVLPTEVSDLPGPQVTPAEPPKSLLDDYLPGKKKLTETEHFIFYTNADGYFPVDQAWWTSQAEVLYQYVSQRLDGAQVKHKIELAFLPPDKRSCPVRGLASYEGIPNIIVYADEQSPRAYLLGVLSHEIGHAIPAEGFPGGLPDQLGLTVGLATYASGKYWLAWKDVPSYDALIARYMKQGLFEAPSLNYDMQGIYPWQDDNGPGCLDRRDRVYAGWGAFLGYLIDTYGWDKALRLFQSPTETKDGKLITYPPDFVGIYGKALNQLETDWLSKVMSERITL